MSAKASGGKRHRAKSGLSGWPDRPKAPELAALLLCAELLQARSVVDGGLAITEASRRNNNFLISLEGALTYFVKCGQGIGGLGTVSHEAWAYRWLASQPAALKDYLVLPHCHAWIEDHDILVLEAIDPATSLGTLIRKGKGLSQRRARALGRTLAALHGLTPPKDDSLPAVPPSWMLSIHRPSLEAARRLSTANLALTRCIQRFDFLMTVLDTLSQDWEPSAVIHGDLKWENVLIRRQAKGRARDIPILVDWEFLALGDPAWDLGCGFAEYLFHWAQTGPDKAHSAEDVDATLSFELERHLGEVTGLWDGYRAGRALYGAEAARHLSKTLRFAGGRLVHKTFEQLQQSAANEAGHLATLQLAANLMERPMEAAVQLLGLRIVS